MRRTAFLVAAVVLALPLSFWAGAKWNGRAVRSTSVQQPAYTCSMHPQYRSDRPGDCPICGMRLVVAGMQGPAPNGTPAVRETQNLIVVPADKRQLIGVRTELVAQGALRQVLRVPGRVAADENRSYQVIAASEGWTRRLGPNPAGTFVRKGELLASYYAPSLQAAQQALLFNLLNTDQLQIRRASAAVAAQSAPIALNLQIAIDTLRGLGMSDRQIDEVQRTRQFASEVFVYSPVTGFVTSRGLSPEQRFDKNAEMYRIADISRVWVMADVFEQDRSLLKPGMAAIVEYQGQRLQARMADALPQFEPESRALKARFELDNPGNLLRPGMFVDVELQIDMPASITVPREAVFDSGLQTTVFVDHGDGSFESRQVETGWRASDRVQIRRGLMEGERIATSGNFLLDSESRMRSAAVAPVEPERDPVCGMDVNREAAATAHRLASHGGRTYYFCSDDCKARFAKQPESYVKDGTK